MNQSQIIAQCKPCLFFLGECKWAIPDQCKHYVGSRIFLARLYLLGGQWPQRSSSNFPFPSFIRKKKKKKKVSFPVECLCFTYWLCSEFHSSRPKKQKTQRFHLEWRFAAAPLCYLLGTSFYPAVNIIEETPCSHSSSQVYTTVLTLPLSHLVSKIPIVYLSIFFFGFLFWEG